MLHMSIFSDRSTAVSDTEGSGFRARGSKGQPMSPLTAGSTSWRSAEGVIQAIHEFLLNGEDSTVEVIFDPIIFLLAVCFEGGFQVSDFHFKGMDLHLSLGYPGLCPNLFHSRRYMERVEDKRPHQRRTTYEECLLSDERPVAGLTSADIKSGRYTQGVDPASTVLRVDSSSWTGMFAVTNSVQSSDVGLLGLVLDAYATHAIAPSHLYRLREATCILEDHFDTEKQGINGQSGHNRTTYHSLHAK